MSSQALLRPAKVQVNRSELRQNLRKTLGRAKGTTVVLVTSGTGEDDDKFVVDREYLDQLLGKFRSTIETLEIMMDRKLVDQVIAAAGQLEADLRRGALHSFEEAFGEN